MARSVNFVWNYCNETSFEAIRRDSKWLSGFDLQKLTKGSSKELRLSSTTVQEICQEYALRRIQFKKRKLRWRGKKSLGWIPFKASGIKFEDGQACYMKHRFKVFQPERIPAKGHRAGEFVQDSRNRWYLCIAVEYEPEVIQATGEVGIDLGLKDVATLSTGERVTNGRYFRVMERRLANAQRYKRKKLAKTLHAKIKNQRLDTLHKASTQIVKKNKTIVVGKLSVKRLVKTRMAKSFNDAATTMFKTMLKYKASAQGHRYVEVDETNTTRTCSGCGSIPDSAPKGMKGLSIREWVCSECGAEHDRDQNAAVNILRLGRQTLVPKVA